MTEVLCVGLGNLGKPLAEWLSSSPLFSRVAVVDISPSALAGFSGGRFVPHNSVAEAPSTDVIVSCLPTSAQVAEAVQQYLARGGARATLWLDCTSGDPLQSTELAARLAAVGTSFLDVGVSGGPPGAAAGTLAAMVGGSADAFAAAAPILAAFTSSVVHCGGPGSGHAVKAVNNTLLAANLWSAGEGLALLARFGVDPASAAAAIGASSGSSKALVGRYKDCILPRTFDYGFSMALHAKDVATALRLLRASGGIAGPLSAPLLRRVGELQAAALAALGPSADHTRVVQLVEALAGVELHAGTPHVAHPQCLPPGLLRSRGIRLLVLDMAGTTVSEGGMVYDCLASTVSDSRPGDASVTALDMGPWHGVHKRAVLRHFAGGESATEAAVDALVAAFEAKLESAYFSDDSPIALMPGLERWLAEARGAGLLLALNTGYSKRIQGAIAERLKMGAMVDAMISSDEVPCGRPAPFMVHRLMERLGVADVRAVCKVGDSVNDVLEGRNAGCGLVVGVLSGADTRQALMEAGADVVLDSLVDLTI